MNHERGRYPEVMSFERGAERVHCTEVRHDGFMHDRDECREEFDGNHHGRGICRGIEFVREGAKDITQGLKNLEIAKKTACEAIRLSEEAAKLMRKAIKEIEICEKKDCEGLHDISEGVRLIEEDVRRHPHC